MLTKSNNMKFSIFLEENEKYQKVSSYLNEKKYTFFFEYKNEIYCSEEEGRLIFAKMKNKDDDLPAGWKNELNFVGVKLINGLRGEESSRFFGHKDLKELKNLDRENIIKKIIRDKNYNEFQFSK